MYTLFFDIETHANFDAIGFMPAPSAPSNYKDAEKIAAYIAEKKAEQVQSAALDPDYGQIIAISMRRGVDGQNITYLSSEIGEKELIQAFWEEYNQAYGSVCGYNIIGFDLPYLMRRSMELNIQIGSIPNLQKYKTSPINDLMGVLYNWQQAKGLKFVCRRYGIHNPLPELDGSMVESMDAETLKAYCANDVHLVVELFKRMNGVYFVEAL